MYEHYYWKPDTQRFNPVEILIVSELEKVFGHECAGIHLKYMLKQMKCAYHKINSVYTHSKKMMAKDLKGRHTSVSDGYVCDLWSTLNKPREDWWV